MIVNLRMQTTAALTGLRELLEEVIGYLTILLKDMQQLPEDLVESAKLLWRKTALARAFALEVAAGMFAIASVACTIVLWYWGFPDTWHAEDGWMPPTTHWIGWAVFALFWLAAKAYFHARQNRKRVRRWGA